MRTLGASSSTLYALKKLNKEMVPEKSPVFLYWCGMLENLKMSKIAMMQNRSSRKLWSTKKFDKVDLAGSCQRILF